MNFVKKSFPFFLVFISSFLMSAQICLAQTEIERTTRLNFEDELIQGDVSSPDLLFILKSKNANCLLYTSDAADD